MSAVPPHAGRSVPVGERVADWLFLRRTDVLLSLIAILAVNFGYWGLSNFLDIFYRSSVNPWVEPIVVAADIGLAIGTLTLAAAGLLQSRAAAIQLRLASRQERREEAQLETSVAMLRPNLEIQVLESQAEPTTLDTFTLTPERWFVWARIRNFGPGAAIDVQVTAFNWPVGGDPLKADLETLAAGGAYKGPILTPPIPIPKDIVNVPYSLAPGDERRFGLQFVIPPPPQAMTSLVEQMVVFAWARDVQKREVSARRLGLRLQFAFSKGGVIGRVVWPRDTIWRCLTEDEIAKIHGLLTERVSWRSKVIPPAEATTPP